MASPNWQQPPAGPSPKPPMSRKRKILIGIAVVVCAPPFVAGMVSAARQQGAPAAAPAQTPVTSQAPVATADSAPRPSPTHESAKAEPTFAYPGAPQCAITYRDRGDGSMSWTATVTVAGELITHAGDTSGNIYRHDVQVTPGPNAFAAPVPLAQIDDIGGNLTGADGQSYGCSIAPAR